MSALGQKQTFAAHKGMSALPPTATSIAYFGMSALGQKRTCGREVRHASFDDVGLVSSHGASERTETGRRTPMAKLVDVWIFDWDKYRPDDLVQKCDSFQPGPALLAALVKSSRAIPLAVLALGCVGRDRHA